MNSLRKWETTGEGKYAFFDSDKEIGSIEISRGTLERVAHAKIGNRELIIKKAGIWKSTIEITDINGATIAKAYPKKWYANTINLDYQGKSYTLKIRNNPLAEYVILENEKEIISYGITAKDGKIGVKINSQQEESDYLFDYLLWYLFVPIAHENMGDALLFLLLVA